VLKWFLRNKKSCLENWFEPYKNIYLVKTFSKAFNMFDASKIAASV